MAPKIPEGWLESSATGKPIEGTRFITFKVPLKEALCNNLRPKDRFSPAMLLEEVPNLSLIVDLTNTNRYYDKNEFVKNGIEHEKIFCPGKVIPPSKLMTQFFDAVDKFMKSANAKDKFIGVHCTHGINRTGYFICNYMVHRLGFKVEDAINAFQTARGHDIIRQYLIDDLVKNASTPPERRKEEGVDNSRPNHGNKRKWNHNSRSANQQKDYSPRPKNKRNFDYNININIHPGNSSEPFLADGPSHSEGFSSRPYNGPTPRFNNNNNNQQQQIPNRPYAANKSNPRHHHDSNKNIRGNSNNSRYQQQQQQQQPRNYNRNIQSFREENWKQDPFYRNTQLNYYDGGEPTTRTNVYSNNNHNHNNNNSRFKWSKKTTNS